MKVIAKLLSWKKKYRGPIMYMKQLDILKIKAINLFVVCNNYEEGDV